MSLRGFVFTLGLLGSCATAYAQTDYSAGKTPAQLFSSDCSACHKTPRGLAKTRDARSLTGFLREHYTTKVESAGALANFLLSSPGGPAEAEGRRRQPAGQPAAPSGAQQGTAAPEAAPQRPARSQSTRSRKPTAAELAREREAAAKAAEEAEKAKLNAYATSGEAAKPLETPAAAVPSPAETAPAVPAPAATPSADAPKPETAKPAESSSPPSPSGAERPAGTPPG